MDSKQGLVIISGINHRKSASQKIKVGLQQLVAGSRNFRLTTISRNDLMSLTEEAAKVSGIPYVTDAYRKEAEAILEG